MVDDTNISGNMVELLLFERVEFTTVPEVGMSATMAVSQSIRKGDSIWGDHFSGRCTRSLKLLRT